MRSSSATLWFLFLVGAALGCGEHGSGGQAGGRGGQALGADGPLGSGGVLGSGGAFADGGGGPDATPAIEVAVDISTATVHDGGAGGVTTGTGGGGGALGADGDVDTFVVDAAGQRADVTPEARDADVDAPMGRDGDLAGVDLPGRSPDYVVIAADGLLASAIRYRDFRRAGGFDVDLAMVGDIVGSAADAASASARIRDYVRSRYQSRDPGRAMYLLLLGDAQAIWPGDRSGVPAGSWQSASGELVVSDNVYADVDGDDVPDLAVGRITADNDDEVDRVRAKVAAYEANYDPGAWNRRLNIFASTSGLGDLADVAIETIVYDITEAIPYDFDVTMTYARQVSPYVYIPEQFSDQVYRRINEGSLLTAYVGHGSRDGFAKLDWNGKAYPILDTEQLEKLAVTHKSPVLVFVACATGDFVGGESVSEHILVQREAPVAIFSSTEVSDPYANAVFIYEVSQAFAGARAARVGDAFLRAKQRILGNNDGVRQKIDSLAAFLVSTGARDALKHSHLHMYTLFGDPAMAVSYAGQTQVFAATAEQPTGASSVKAGAELALSASLPAAVVGAEALVTLESPRKVVLGQLSTVPADGDSNRDSVIAKNYAIANDKVVVAATVPVAGTSFSTQLAVPATATAGQYYIKVFVHDSSRDYAGSLPMVVY